MSALKKFFDKVKKDTKFKKAGDGRSLRSEDDRPRVRPEVSHSQASVSASRKSTTDSNQKAAQAALARLESKMGNMGHNTNLLKEVYTDMGFSKVCCSTVNLLDYVVPAEMTETRRCCFYFEYEFFRPKLSKLFQYHTFFSRWKLKEAQAMFRPPLV